MDGISPPNQNRATALTVMAKLDGLSQKPTADIYSLMAIIAKMAQEGRKSDREVRESERRAQYDEMQSAVDNMRKAADFAFAASVVSGAFKIVGGATQAASGAAANSKIFKLGDNPSVSALDAIRNEGKIMDGAVQAHGAIGDIMASLLNRSAEGARADQKQAETNAQKHETAAQNANDFMNNLRELMQDVRRMMQDIAQLNSDSERKAASV